MGTVAIGHKEASVRNFSSIEQKVSSYSAWVLLAASLAVLAGCGGAGTQTTTTGGTTTPTASSVQLLVSNPQILSSGATPIDMTAVVLGPTGQTLSGRSVSFSTEADSSAFINNISTSGISDSNGLVTAKLNLGANKTNRTLSVSVSVDGASKVVSVDVTGTTIAISGSTSLSFNATTTLSIVVKDSAGTPLPSATVTVASQAGNTIVLSPTTGITNSAGQISATVTATKTGNDVITATAAGTSKTQTLTVSNANFGFTTPAADTQIPLNTATPVAINWTSTGVPASGQVVNFSASRGTITGAPATTNSAGSTPGVSISSSTAGPAIISAAGSGGSPAASLNVVFVATSASTVTPQATPSVVQPTTTSSSQTNNSSTISAVVRDATGNLVKDARVNFTITADPSGGSLSASTAVTDISGSASVVYLAGATSSPQNGVIISAIVSDINGVPLSPVVGPGTVTLTVGGLTQFVRLATDNLIRSSGTTYNKDYVALVTDAAGNPVPAGTTVRFALRPSRYRKGFYTFFDPLWNPTVNVTCANEDLDFNGILNPGEDINGNGRLDPGGVAGVNASATTDANGFAIATINYAKDFAFWAEVVLEARAGAVVGDDPPNTVTFFLPGLSTDYDEEAINPPGQPSPFGIGNAPDNVCTNTN